MCVQCEMLSTSDLARSFLTQERRLSGRNSSVGLECRVPSRAEEKFVCEAVVQPAGLGVPSTPPGQRRSLVCEAVRLIDSFSRTSTRVDLRASWEGAGKELGSGWEASGRMIIELRSSCFKGQDFKRVTSTPPGQGRSLVSRGVCAGVWPDKGEVLFFD